MDAEIVKLVDGTVTVTGFEPFTDTETGVSLTITSSIRASPPQRARNTKLF